MKNRIIAIILSVTLSLLCLTSCAQNDPHDSQSTDALVSQTQSGSTAQSVPSSSIVIEPIPSSYYNDLYNFGVPGEDQKGRDTFFFRYQCESMPKVVNVWAEIYQDGKLIDRVEKLITNKGKTGFFYLFARSEENPQWTVGIGIDEDIKELESHSSTSNEGLVNTPFKDVNILKPEGKFDIQPESETLLLALLYGEGEEAAQISLQELQQDTSLIGQAKIGVLLKCQIS
ncbi:MAG TPA: hypothetical protein IAD07_03620 [Candidatus Fimivicinus intestinavium]|nr:hypothetical protein [Candidatus Fimivicinus intestinavium]